MISMILMFIVLVFLITAKVILHEEDLRNEENNR